MKLGDNPEQLVCDFFVGFAIGNTSRDLVSAWGWCGVCNVTGLRPDASDGTVKVPKI